MVAIHNNSCTPQVLDKQRLIWKRAINYFVCWSFVLSQKTNCQKDRKRRRKKQSIGTQGKICNFFIQFKFGPKFSIAWFFVWNLISTRKVLLAKTINVYFKKKKKIQLNSWCCLVDGAHFKLDYRIIIFLSTEDVFIKFTADAIFLAIKNGLLF